VTWVPFHDQLILAVSGEIRGAGVVGGIGVTGTARRALQWYVEIATAVEYQLCRGRCSLAAVGDRAHGILGRGRCTAIKKVTRTGDDGAVDLLAVAVE